MSSSPPPPTTGEPSPPALAPRGVKPTLWVEIALSLLGITLATILLNAGAFWLLSAQGELERHTDLTVASARALRAQLEGGSDDREQAWRRAVSGFRRGQLEVSTLWIVDKTGQVVVEVAGAPPSPPDAGLREALYGRDEHIAMSGSRLSGRVVEVTEPLMAGGAVVGALRIGVPWDGVGPVRSGLGFVLVYTLVSGSIIGVFGYTLFRRRLIRPVQQLQAATGRIARGEFGHAAQVDASRELEALCDSLNAMSASLEGYRERTAEQVRSLEAANDELRRVQEELIRSEKLATVGRLAAGIAHEVGNPLAAVLGYTELLSSGLDGAPVEADLLRRTRREVERIHVIIRDLLDYARPGSGESDAVALGPLLSEAASTVAPLPAMREVEVRIEVDEGLPAAWGEAEKLHQVLVNLLMNAADAIGGPGRITLSASAADGALVISCRDSGPGLREADLAKVFEPFFSTKEPGQGTGLGLATSQRIIEGMGGWIRAENHPEGGAVLRLGVPAAPP